MFIDGYWKYKIKQLHKGVIDYGNFDDCLSKYAPAGHPTKIFEKRVTPHPFISNATIPPVLRIEPFNSCKECSEVCHKLLCFLTPPTHRAENFFNTAKIAFTRNMAWIWGNYSYFQS